MVIKIKHNNKTIECNVADKRCKEKMCLCPHKYKHYSKSIDGISSSWEDNFYSCAVRNYFGCPDKYLEK